jgi:DNA-binding transcriptional LysR family regulator
LPALREQALDFAVVRLSRPLSDEPGTDDLNVELLFHDQLVVVATRFAARPQSPKSGSS